MVPAYPDQHLSEVHLFVRPHLLRSVIFALSRLVQQNGEASSIN